MATMIAFIRGAPAATVFLTRIPVPASWYAPRSAWHYAPVWFPVVGAVIGALLAALWHSVRFLDPLLAAAIVTTASLILTGAIHEDGLADTADALGGGQSTDHIFAILKDSRIGTFGASALVCSLALRITALATLGAHAGSALVVANCFARLGAVSVLGALPYVTPADSSKSQAFARAHPGHVAGASCAAMVVAGLMLATGAASPAVMLAAVAITIGVVILCGSYFHSRLRGVTGDLAGAAEQTCECALLVAFAALLAAR